MASLSRDWSLISAVFLADGLLLTTSNFRLLWRPECVILLSACALAGIAWFYRHRRAVPRLAHMASSGCLLVLFTNAAAILNYILAGLLPLPLWDQRFDAADRALGLDWLSMYHWIGAHPAIDTGSNIVYLALGPEFLILLLVLDGLGRSRDATALRRYFTTSALVTVFSGILMPAAGAFVFYHLPIAHTTACVIQVAALRDGSLRLIDLSNAQGLVAFPSFHAALAVICAYAARSLRYLALPAALLNVLIIGSAPAIGGHYYIDIFAGLVLAAIVITAEHFVSSPAAKLSQAWGASGKKSAVPEWHQTGAAD